MNHDVYDEENFLSLLNIFLGRDVVHALLESKISYPRIHQIAINEAFLKEENYTKSDIESLKSYYRILTRNGQYPF